MKTLLMYDDIQLLGYVPFELPFIFGPSVTV